MGSEMCIRDRTDSAFFRDDNAAVRDAKVVSGIISVVTSITHRQTVKKRFISLIFPSPI